MRRPRAGEPLPAVLAGWPGWTAFAALAGGGAVGIAAALLVAIGFAGASPAAARLALALVSAAGSAGVLVWLAARTGAVGPRASACAPLRSAALRSRSVRRRWSLPSPA